MRRIWAGRGLIALVTFFNLQCALAFLAWPDKYAPGFILSGIGGRAAVQGMGILFLMWNIPYVFALLQPQRNRLSLWEAVLMQGIGAVGETLLLLQWKTPPPALQASLLRFILFDGLGWVALIAALILTRAPVPRQ